VISYKLLGTREFFVIHHTECGMQFFSNEVMRGLLASSLEMAELTPQGFRDVGHGPGSRGRVHRVAYLQGPVSGRD
jgi:carbonic anhydrase